MSGWIRWDHGKAMESPWFLSLTSGQKWCFVAFVGYANAKPRGYIKKMPLSILARRLEAEEADIKAMLESAAQWVDPITDEPDPKILDHGDKWQIVNYDKYNPPTEDTTNAERQARYRESKKEVTAVTESNGDVTPTITITSTITNTEEEKSLPVGKCPPVSDPRIQEVFQKWNEFATANPPIPKTRKLTDKLAGSIAARLKEPDWNLDRIFAAILVNDFQSGRGANSVPATLERATRPNWYLERLDEYEAKLAAGKTGTGQTSSIQPDPLDGVDFSKLPRGSKPYQGGKIQLPGGEIVFPCELTETLALYYRGEIY